jgi:hypothetical protein
MSIHSGPVANWDLFDGALRHLTNGTCPHNRAGNAEAVPRLQF